MPYITKEERGKYDGYIASIVNQINRLEKEDICGHLNYVITKMLIMTEPKRYKHFNALIGALESAKLELYRRMIAKYEDEKIEQNGDVY